MRKLGCEAIACVNQSDYKNVRIFSHRLFEWIIWKVHAGM